MDRYEAQTCAHGAVVRDHRKHSLVGMFADMQAAVKAATDLNELEDPVRFTAEELSDISHGLRTLVRLLDLATGMAGTQTRDEYQRLAVRAASAAFREVSRDV